MTPQTRRNVFRYGIAIDLVILATGVGMLVPPAAGALVALFAAAVLLSTWKGGWQGGLTALALSVVMLATMFGFHAAPLAAFTGAVALTGGALAAVLQPRTATPAPAAEVAPDAREERAAREREQREREERIAREREEAAARKREERAAKEREKAEAKRQRDEAKRVAKEREQREREERVARERREAEEREARAAKEREERAAKEREEREREERAAQEREQREREERAARERREAEEREARAAKEREERAAQEREQREREERAAKEREERAAKERPPQPTPPPQPQPSLLGTVSGWFRREPAPRAVNLNNTTRRPANRTTPARPARPVAPRNDKERGPRLVFLERRRGTVDTIVPRLRQRGVEVSVVERWVDAVDELLRLKPDAFFVDVEHPDFEKAHRVTTDKSRNLPIVLTGRSVAAAPANVRYASFAVRPYDLEDIVRLGQQAMSRPDELLAMQTIQRVRPAQPAAVAVAPKPSVEPAPPTRQTVSNDSYEVLCFTCRIAFNAIESDWCSCLAKERTFVCTNCLACFCKAPPAYKEKFWVQAPPRLFERKTLESKRPGLLPPNPPVAAAGRPLVLTVEDDEEIQAIVQRVCSNLGYGFIHATNGQDGLDLAHEYRPNLILSDAFMPKLDGREMCRMLKEEPAFADTRMVVMTGLYTDTKYRSEALKRFHVDDYVAKPVSITELINILQKHLEGVSGAPVQEDLYEMHRKELVELGENDVALADALYAEAEPETVAVVAPPVQAPKADAYPVSCYNCEKVFDATHAEWCRCVGRDNTLVCTECGGCFCKAPAAYKERFWIDAPPSLFERKMIGSKRNISARSNPTADDVKRPLILLVEDDENVQLIVRTVVTNMGYGFVVGANGQEGLTLAREYAPDLILSDAFMPKLDGREMCRLLKEDPATCATKAIIMTGLYTDRKYRNEALDYFKVDDYVAKPLAVDDLIKLFKKHLPLEVVTAH